MADRAPLLVAAGFQPLGSRPSSYLALRVPAAVTPTTSAVVAQRADLLIYSVRLDCPRQENQGEWQVPSGIGAGKAHMPGESRADDRLEIRYLSAPAEEFGCKCGIGNEHRWITSPSRGVVTRNAPSADGLGHPNHLSHRVAATGSEIQRARPPPGEEVFERPQMGFGQVLDVDVVADGRTVRCRIIRSVDVDTRPLS